MISSRILLTLIVLAVVRSSEQEIIFDTKEPDNYKDMQKLWPRMFIEGQVASTVPGDDACPQEQAKSGENCAEVCNDYTPYVIESMGQRHILVQAQPYFSQTFRERKCKDQSECFQSTFGGSPTYKAQCTNCTTPVAVYIWNPVEGRVKQEIFHIHTCCKCSLYKHSEL